MDFNRYRQKIDENLTGRLLAPELNLEESLRLLKSGDASLKGRALALMNVINSVLPDKTIRHFRDSLRRTNLKQLPFRKNFVVHKKQIGEGVTKDVYLLEDKNKNKAFVVKIEYCKEPCSVEVAVNKAKHN